MRVLRNEVDYFSCFTHFNGTWVVLEEIFDPYDEDGDIHQSVVIATGFDSNIEATTWLHEQRRIQEINEIEYSEGEQK